MTVYVVEVAPPGAGFALLNIYRTRAAAYKAVDAKRDRRRKDLPDVMWWKDLGEHTIQVRRVRVLT